MQSSEKSESKITSKPEDGRNVQHVRSRFSSDSSSSSESSSDDESDDSMPSPPDGGYGWMIVFSAFMINLISDGISFSFGILYTELLDQFGESKSLTSWVGSLFYGLCLIGGPLASTAATKFGCRKVTIVGGVVASAGCFLSSFAESIGFLCFSLGVLTGLGMSMGYVTSLVSVAFYFEDRRALATGLSVCGSGIGTFLFAPLTDYLISVYGWRGTLVIWSGITLNLVVFGALLRPLEFTPYERRQRALQKFERLSRTASFTSFSNTVKSLSRNASHADSLENDEGELDEGLEHCSSQIQIPTFIKEKDIHIPIDILKEAKGNAALLKEYIKKHFLERELDNDSEEDDGAFKKTDTVVVCEGNGTESVGLVNGVKHTGSKTSTSSPKGSCLKKTNQGDGRNTGKPHRPKRVQMSNYLPLYRKDLFFRGNLTRIIRPQGGKVRSTSCPELYKGRRADSESESSDDEWDSVLWKYLRFSKHIKRVLKTMFDPSILLNPLYVMFAVSNFILYFWYDVPYIFMADRAEENGISETQASFLISILGIVNTMGQILFGIIGDRQVNLNLLYGFSIVMCGVMVLLVPLWTDFVSLAILSGGFGFFISANYCLSTVILVEYLGLDKLTNAYGLTMLVQGIGNLVGPPTAAALYDITANYDATFFTGGGCIILSGMLLLTVALHRRCQRSHFISWATDSPPSKVELIVQINDQGEPEQHPNTKGLVPSSKLLTFETEKACV